MDEKNRGLQWSHIEPYCLVRTLLRQLWMLLLAAAACAMAAWIVLSCFVTRQYTSSTTFAVTARASTLYYTNITAAADMAASYSQLLQSRVLRQTMEQNLGMSLDGTVSAQQLGETNLIRVTVTADTPRQALVLLKAVSDNYGTLSAHVSSTAVLSQLNAPTLSVAPSRSYNMPKICLLAGVIGAGLTAAAVAWASVTSGTVQTQEGARSDLDAKLISTVPHEGRRTRKLLGWMDDRRERRSRRGGKRLISGEFTDHGRSLYYRSGTHGRRSRAHRRFDPGVTRKISVSLPGFGLKCFRHAEAPVGAGPQDLPALREGVRHGEIDRAAGGHAIHQIEYGHPLRPGPEIDLDGRRRHGAQPESAGQVRHPIMSEPPDPVKAGNPP